jgi:hypothetical protein
LKRSVLYGADLAIRQLRLISGAVMAVDSTILEFAVSGNLVKLTWVAG